MKKSDQSGCTKIIIAIVGAIGTIIAAIIGGPVFEEVVDYFKEPDATSVPGPNVGGGGPLRLTASADPVTVGATKWATITVLVLSDQGVPVSDANVTIEAGGGTFQQSGTATTAGQTDRSGVFRARWKCDPCAPSYEMVTRATKPFFDEGQSRVTLFVQ